MWFALDRPAGQAGEATEREVPNLPAVADLGELATGRAGLAFAEVLSQWAQNRRWFRGKARRVKGADIHDAIPLKVAGGRALIVVLNLQFSEGEPEEYLVPVLALSPAAALSILSETPWAAIAHLGADREDANQEFLVDGMRVPAFCEAFLEAIAGRRRARGIRGELASQPTRSFRRLAGPSSFAPSNIVPDASMRKPLSLVRHAPIASKFSSENPMGSIKLWQDAQAGFLRCSSRRSRTD